MNSKRQAEANGGADAKRVKVKAPKSEVSLPQCAHFCCPCPFVCPFVADTIVHAPSITAQLKYLPGFGAELESEALEGALPIGQLTPQKSVARQPVA